jgi:hypothetical protein
LFRFVEFDFFSLTIACQHGHLVVSSCIPSSCHAAAYSEGHITRSCLSE